MKVTFSSYKGSTCLGVKNCPKLKWNSKKVFRYWPNSCYFPTPHFPSPPPWKTAVFQLSFQSNSNPFSFQVQQISSRLLSSYDINLDDFLYKIDSSIAACRDAFQQLEGKEILLSENDWERIQMQVGWLFFFVCLRTPNLPAFTLFKGMAGFSTTEIFGEDRGVQFFNITYSKSGTFNKLLYFRSLVLLQQHLSSFQLKSPRRLKTLLRVKMLFICQNTPVIKFECFN